ncbi:MAG: hypothetical protein DWP97_04555 [Calditrichaeota bacterium]|nr:MAG: hypothetical protein DWP97_04555 [Calditrichota bacterium]
MHIHLFYEFGEEFDKTFISLIPPEVKITVGAELKGVGEYEILVGAFRDDKYFKHSKKLHTLIIPWAGVPKMTAEILRENYTHINVQNLHHNSQATAEMAITLMLSTMKRIPIIDADFRKSDWSRRYKTQPIQLTKGKRAVVVGFGAIGKKIANMCKAFGMDVSIIKRSHADAVNFYTPDRLSEVLLKADCLLLAVPSTPDTRGMLTAKELALIPDDAVIINIARADIIDEKALFNELQSGRLRAGLDVWYNYPKGEEEYKSTDPSQFPFGELENVVMTPHLAGDSIDNEILRAEALAKLINQAYNNEPMENKVDLGLGY